MGNLVGSGSNGCKIGAPTDCGLYFHFGSLVGWAGGTGDGTGEGSPALSVKVKPSGYNGKTSWPAGYHSSVTGNIKNYDLSSTDVAATGIGDPCRYYLGGAWRTPTAAQWLTLMGVDGDNTNKTAPLKHTSSGLLFPASGLRVMEFGTFHNVGTLGQYTSSSGTSNGGCYHLHFYLNSPVVPQNILVYRSFAFPVRCVSSSAP